eukprot:1955557-Rhodomonas_salina.1
MSCHALGIAAVVSGRMLRFRSFPMRLWHLARERTRFQSGCASIKDPMPEPDTRQLRYIMRYLTSASSASSSSASTSPAPASASGVVEGVE